MELFDILPESFFTLLASPNKAIYSSIILKTFKIYETSGILGIEKKLVVDELVHFLENKNYELEENDFESKSKEENIREVINYTLRKMEDTGWIYIDLNEEYIEFINFTDSGITICEALENLFPYKSYEYNYDLFNDDSYTKIKYDSKEYQGYIFTIYCLLNNSDTNYYYKFFEIYKNTKLLLRSIRKLDSRLKNYLSNLVDNIEIKDLMEALLKFRSDFVDNGYLKLKVSDNFNRYKIKIISRLEEYQNNEDIFKNIIDCYTDNNLSFDGRYKIINKKLDEIIDVFKSLDISIYQIDEKARQYVKTSISKIKFLLSEDDNIIGKLNLILKHIKESQTLGIIDKSVKEVSKLFSFSYMKQISEKSYFEPRSSYKRQAISKLMDDMSFSIDYKYLMDSIKMPYDPKDVEEFLLSNLDSNNEFILDNILIKSNDYSYSLNCLFSLIFALDNDLDYSVDVKDNLTRNQICQMRSFIIKKLERIS